MHRNADNDEVVHFPVRICSGESPDAVWHISCANVCKPIQLVVLEEEFVSYGCDQNKATFCQRRKCSRSRPGFCKNNTSCPAKPVCRRKTCIPSKRSTRCERSSSRESCTRSRSREYFSEPMIVPISQSICKAPLVSRGPTEECKCRWVAWKFEERGRCPRFVFGRITKGCCNNDPRATIEKVYYAAACDDGSYLRVTDTGMPPSLLTCECLDDDYRVFEYQRLQPYPLFLLKHVATGCFVRKCDRLLTLSRVEHASTWILRC